MKKHLLIGLIWLCSLAGYSANTIVIEQKDGTTTRIKFESELSLSYSNSQLLINAGNRQLSFDLPSLRKASFVTEGTGINNAPDPQIQFYFNNNQLTIKNAQPNSPLYIYTLGGKPAGSYLTNEQGYLSIDLSYLHERMYVIVTNGISYKISQQ